MRSRLSIAALSLILALAFVAAPRSTASANNWGNGWHGGNVHCVQYGETLYGIAWANGTTAQAIAHANGLWNPNYVRAGQCLTIPSGWDGGYKGGDGGYKGGDGGYPGMHGGSGRPGMDGDRYCVRYGDTVYSIANRFGTSAWAIAKVNGLWNPNYIRAGQMLTIPGRGW